MVDPQKSEELRQARRQWEATTLRESLEQQPERTPRFSTLSDLEIARVYAPDDLPALDPARDLGLPGEYPFTRGIHPTMYRRRLWTMRQFAGFGSPEDSNRRFHYLLEHGQTGLSVAFDMPTLMGYDSDHARAQGEVGREGVAVDTLEDMEILFRGLPLDRITTSMTINAPANVLLAMYVVAAERAGYRRDQLGGTTQTDMLKEFIAQKEWIVPPRPSMRLIQDMLAFGTRELPRWNIISISGYHIREAGATAVQELAFTLADGIAYVQAGVEAGLDVDAFAPRLSFFFDIHNDFFEEIAKLRAARRMWARFVRQRFGATNPRSWMLRTHAQTAGVSLTARQPMNNVVRTTIQALAAVLAGCQSLHTNSMDETYALPTTEAVTLALRTQQVIAYESGVTDTVDPLAGSYYLESLTQRMEEGFERYLREIEKMGGMVEAIERGYPQREITEASFHFQQQVDEGEKIVVGINKYATEAEPPIPTLAIDPEVERKQIARLTETRRTRDRGRWNESIDALRNAAKHGEELMPRFLECARAHASVGEQVHVLKEVFGEYHDPGYF